MPPTSGVSGPTIVSSTCSRLARSTSPSKSVAATGTLRILGSLAVPALPGATSTWSTFADWASFHAIACSRPPLPMTRTFTLPLRYGSMPEMPHAGEDHGHAVLVGGFDDLVVAHRAAGLHYRADAALRGGIDAVAKRKVRVGRHGRAGERDLGFLGFQRSDACAHDAARLASADAERRAAARVHDGVGLHELHDGPGELQVAQLLARRRAPRDDLGRGEIDAAAVRVLEQDAAFDRLD